jgi:hypothetical protein
MAMPARPIAIDSRGVIVDMETLPVSQAWTFS